MTIVDRVLGRSPVAVVYEDKYKRARVPHAEHKSERYKKYTTMKCRQAEWEMMSREAVTSTSDRSCNKL